MSGINLVQVLAQAGLEPVQIAQNSGLKVSTVRTHLSTLRRQGKIGLHEGRSLIAFNIPQPRLLVNLPAETRDLLDIEAEDRGVTPMSLVEKIVSTVLLDQELVDLVLGEENERSRAA